MTGCCAVVLAAGEGSRLRPLTAHLPKALCPVGNVSLLDRALARLAALGFVGPDAVAVNAWYLADQVAAAVAGRAHLSREPAAGPLGTAGALGALRDWIDGRGVLVGNADAYLTGDTIPARDTAPSGGPAPAGDPAGAGPGPVPAGLAAAGRPDLAPLLAGWDGTRTRLLVVPGPPDEFAGCRFAGHSLLSWSRVRDLPAEPAHLVRVWRAAQAADELDVVPYPGGYLDTGTPADYLAANLDAAGPSGLLVAADATVTAPVTRSVIGRGAVVRGPVDRTVVWPGGHVGRDESLAGAIRYGRSGTVQA